MPKNWQLFFFFFCCPNFRKNRFNHFRSYILCFIFNLLKLSTASVQSRAPNYFFRKWTATPSDAGSHKSLAVIKSVFSPDKNSRVDHNRPPISQWNSEKINRKYPVTQQLIFWVRNSSYGPWPVRSESVGYVRSRGV